MGAAREGVQFSDISITKAFDVASPLLMLAVAKGSHLATMTLSFVRTGKEQQTAYLTYQLAEVLVSSLSDSASSGGGNPEESVSFAFGMITVTYLPQLATGALGKPVIFSWNVRLNGQG